MDTAEAAGRANTGGILTPTVPPPLACPRTARGVIERLRALLSSGELDLPLPGAGGTGSRWARLAWYGRQDLVLARLVEGHTDAVAILAEAGRLPAPTTLYGVWAARSGGTGAVLRSRRDGWALAGRVRFCSGAHGLDRALVVAMPADGPADADPQLVEITLAGPGIERHEDTWQPVGMDASDSADVSFHDVPVRPAALIGEPGFYLRRPGFALGGAGVAAVWLGGTAGVVDGVLGLLDLDRSDEHQLANLGAVYSALRSAEATLVTAAERIDSPETDPADTDRAETDRASGADVTMLAQTCRAVVERCAREVLDRVLRITGPTPLSRQRSFGQRLADLQLYVRQHHAERDLAALGRLVLAGRAR